MVSVLRPSTTPTTLCPVRSVSVSGLERQLDPERIRDTCLRRPRHRGVQEGAVGSPDVEARSVAVAEVTDVHVAGLLDDVEHGHRAAAHELPGPGDRLTALAVGTGSRTEMLDRHCPRKMEVRRDAVGDRPGVDQRGGHGAAGKVGPTRRQCRLEHDVLAAGAEGRIGKHANLPRARPPHRLGPGVGLILDI